jgi:hypothetical protein
VNDSGSRIDIPGEGFSMLSRGRWVLQPNPVEVPESHEGLGAFLEHVPSGVVLNVRLWRANDPGWAGDLEAEFARYADISWPGSPRTVSTWRDRVLRGVTGVFEAAIHEGIVREWMVSDGTAVANASTFATAQDWDRVLEDCELLIRSIRFAHG